MNSKLEALRNRTRQLASQIQLVVDHRMPRGAYASEAYEPSHVPGPLQRRLMDGTVSKSDLVVLHSAMNKASKDCDFFFGLAGSPERTRDQMTTYRPVYDVDRSDPIPVHPSTDQVAAQMENYRQVAERAQVASTFFYRLEAAASEQLDAQPKFKTLAEGVKDWLLATR